MNRRISSFRDHVSSFYLTNRFFALAGATAAVAALGFWFGPLYPLALLGLLTLIGASAFDGYRLQLAARRVSAVRIPPSVFSLGDSLDVRLEIENAGGLPLGATVLDELPEQLQIRDHRLEAHLPVGEKTKISYPLRPTTRGPYRFGNINLYLRSVLSLVERRVQVAQSQEVSVYPSIVGMKTFSAAGPATLDAGGRRRPRPVTKSYEFDQIKEYVPGDDLRNVNWKATARRGHTMVNTYEEERSQRIYSFIDKGRTMLMPFDGLSLLDHSINAALALSRVVLDRGDRAGLLTFSDKLGDFLMADGKPDQLRKILETLYRQQERSGESDYDLVYHAARRFLPARSLLLFFTNFESTYALDRVMPVLRRLSRQHSLVVILFENTEIAALTGREISDLGSVYLKNTARRYVQERHLMALRLRRNGIKVILTRPEDLSGEVVARYLDLKRRGL